MVLSLTDPPGRAQHINYLEPAGNPGIFGPDSVSWRVLSNPVPAGSMEIFLQLAYGVAATRR
jgi:uncharacterized protein (DUF2236 family)